MKLRTVSHPRITWLTLVLALIGAGLTFVRGCGAPVSLLAGSGFMVLNFHLLRMLVSLLISPDSSKGVVAVVLSLKLILFVMLIAAVFYSMPIEPMSFALGVTLFLVAIVVDSTLLGRPVVTSGR